ncbi:MAG TPA: methylated-DNA--[protein]-cysteine S-methyltransferase [Streptosporangiaceae bacterium]|jgi:methylated-DNA-[protein]-cysteine S-methyltransferase|nr:methylated-DNA--[protein]-cysteine S-methyltransferase [Streptosporangiaceae bacterium]
MISKNGAARLACTTIGSPLGPLMLMADDDALAGLYMNGRAPAKVLAATVLAATGTGSDAGEKVFAETARQLGEYFDGDRQVFDLPLALHGTAFQRTVWEALLGIGYGRTVSYGQLADQIGRPTASRAVGLANGRNPVSIIVPCHRVVGSDGSLTGYGGGVDNKRRLLDLEQRVTGACLPG